MNNTDCTFYGKYRGIVTDNQDPLMMGRVRARVPDVMGDQESGWAMPCAPFGGSNTGFFALPPSGAGVWIEFEHGDPDYPIWTGCFWAQGELPATPAIAETKVLKTDTATITLNDVPGAGGIAIETKTGMKIVMDISGVEVTNGQGASIKLTFNQVSVNNGALEVM